MAVEVGDHEPGVRVLGPPEIHGSSAVAVRGRRQHGLLALLCSELGRRVSTIRLEDELWDGQAVSEAAVRVTVNRLRNRFLTAGRPDPIVFEAGGYRLDLDPDDVDLTRFERLVECAVRDRTRGRPEDAVAHARRGADLWRGSPFEGLADVPGAASASDRARRLRVDLAVQLGGSLLGLGRDDEALETLSSTDIPAEAAVHREDLTGLVLIAAARLGRRDLAVEAYTRLERDLDQDVGIAPGRDLQDLRAAVLAGDTAGVDRAAGPFMPEASPSTPVPAVGEHGRAVGWSVRFVGRSETLGHLDGHLVGGRVVVVAGGPGMGKTTLADEVARRVAAAGGGVVRLAGSRVDPGPGPLLGSLRRLAGPDGPDPFGDLLAPATTDMDPTLHRFRVHQCALGLLRAASPEVVVVDDLQWSDQGAVALLRDLIDGCAEPAWLLLTRSDGRSSAATDLIDELRSSRRATLDELVLDPMAPDEVRALVRSRLPGAGGGGSLDDELVEGVVSRSGGWPFLAVELTRHLARGGTEDTIPSSLRRAVELVARDTTPATWEAVELLAVVGAEVPVAAVLDGDGGRGRGRGDGGASLVHTGLVRVVAGRAVISHDLIRDAVLATLTPEALAAGHHRAARVLGPDPGSSRAAVARHLLAAGPGARAELEHEVAPALAELRAAAAFAEAADLASAFLDVAGAASATSDGVSGRIEVGASLLVAGRVDEGLAVLDAVALQARRLGDPVIEASAVLARGPVDVGGAHTADTLDESVELLRRLPSSAWRLRIQLGCWVAHHQLVAGRDEQVDELLDGIEELATGHDDADLRALVLGIRYQATGRCSVSPSEGAEAHDRLRRWAALSDNLSGDAMTRLFALDRAGVSGSLRDHGEAVERLADVLPTFPRADLRWYVEAGRAAALLAAGDLDRAAEQVAVAGEVGRRFQVGAAVPVERMHQFLLLAGREQLAVLAPLFQEPLQEGDEPVRIALTGFIGLHAGDLDRAGQAARLLAAHPRLLASAGATWPALAHVAGELALATRSAGLGERIAAELRPRTGTGLSMLGLVLLGSVDRPRGLGLAAAGRREARSVLEHAAAQDAARGQVVWCELARRHLESLGAGAGPSGV